MNSPAATYFEIDREEVHKACQRLRAIMASIFALGSSDLPASLCDCDYLVEALVGIASDEILRIECLVADPDSNLSGA